MREWTHRLLLVRYLGTLGLTIAALGLLGVAVDSLVSRELAVYVGSFGAVVACFGLPQGYGRLCASASIAEASRPGAELKILPLLAAALSIYLLTGVVREYPRPQFVTLALAASGVALFWAVLAGCRAIARAGSAT